MSKIIPTEFTPSMIGNIIVTDDELGGDVFIFHLKDGTTTTFTTTGEQSTDIRDWMKSNGYLEMEVFTIDTDVKS